MDEKRIRFERRVGKIGFMGRGSRLPGGRGPSDAPHAIALRIGSEKVSTSLNDTEAARHDFARMPAPLEKVFSRTPRGVVRPETAQDAADAAGICFEERTRVVPRGAGTGGLGGVVPVRGGVVIDMLGLGGLVDLDAERAEATAGAGAPWGDVIEALRREGFAPLAYPSSGSVSTVGGWVSSGGYGVGTLKHGSFHSHVRSLEVGLPSGFLVKATGGEGRYSIPSFACTEGQIGIVTRVTFAVKPAPEKRATYLLRLKVFGEGLEVYRKLAALERPPDSVDLMSRGAAAQYGRGWDGPVLLVTASGTETEVNAMAGALRDVVAAEGFEIDASFRASDLFAARLAALREGSADKPFYSGSLLADTGTIEGVVGPVLESSTGDDLALECRAVDRGTHLVTAGYRAQAGGMSPIRAFARARAFVAAGAGVGGVPYGVGLWNSPYIDVILRGRRKELRRIKSEVDRLRIMNPGKFFSMTTRSGLPVPGWLLRAYLGIAGRS